MRVKLVFFYFVFSLQIFLLLNGGDRSADVRRPWCWLLPSQLLLLPEIFLPSPEPVGELAWAGQSFVKLRFLAKLNANYSPILLRSGMWRTHWGWSGLPSTATRGWRCSSPRPLCGASGPSSWNFSKVHYLNSWHLLLTPRENPRRRSVGQEPQIFEWGFKRNWPKSWQWKQKQWKPMDFWGTSSA